MKRILLIADSAAGLPEAEFQKKVIGGIETVTGKTEVLETAQQKILADVTRLDGETKRALEDLTKVKGNVNEFSQTLARVQGLLKREERAAFGDPIARISASEEHGRYLVANFKRAAGLPLTAVEKTAITGIDSGIGAAVIPQETSNMIYDALLRYGQWSTLGVMPIGSRTQIVPLVSARPTAYWVAQGAQITEGAVTGTSVTLTIKEAAAWLPVANAQLEDADPSFGGYLADLLAQAVAYRMDWACFAADGTNDTTDGAFTGIAVGGTAAGAASGNVSVATLDYDDFVKCLTTVDAGVLGRQAKWWIHPTILAKITLIKDSNGRPIFQNALEAPSPGAIGSICGYPVIVTGTMPSTDSTSSVVAVFGDPQAQAVGVRKNIQFDQSADFQFDYNRTAFRTIMRGGTVTKLATGLAKLTTAAG
jgi:HK97 family phage major capsid protein